MTRFGHALLAFATALLASAQNERKPLPEISPLISWDFDTSLRGSSVGKAALSKSSLTSPEYPTFPAENTSLSLDGSSAWKLRESDLSDHKSLRFTNGDSLTIETWVSLNALRSGSFTYLIGKGRHQNKAFTPENQNWALRLKGDNGTALPTFLFRSAGAKSNFHRWTASQGFADDRNWHHLALSYTFGKPKSIVTFIDGLEVKQGTWDMGGPTTTAPVTDADDIVIGTGNGGSPANSLDGSIDSLALYREVVPPALLLARYQHLAPPTGPNPENIPTDSVLIEICTKGIPAGKAWPKKHPTATETFTRSHFAFPTLPFHYVATGVRGDRKSPFLLRASSRITLPPGTHRLLLRGRNSARLIIDGKKVLQTGFTPGSQGALGYTADQDDFLDPGDPNFRFVTPGNEEALTTFTSAGGQHLISMQQLISSAGNRPEPGEFVTAISLEGSTDWHLLTPTSDPIAYTDQHYPPFEKSQQLWADQINTSRRATLRQKHAPYWLKRRQAAHHYLAQIKPIIPPAPTTDLPAHNTIDHFLNARIQTISTQLKDHKPNEIDFYRAIHPILEQKCFSCHQGKKTKGDLDLSSLASALEGGEFDGPAITPQSLDDSAILHRITTNDSDEVMPPKGDPVTPEEADLLTRWIKEGARWPELNVDRIHLTPLSDDLTFLRRLSLDTIGVPPTLAEIDSFLTDPSPDMRARAIDHLLTDPRWADRWMGYWQDILAENPNIINPTLNNTGPFRWWLYESLLDDKPLDLMVTELIRMEGSDRLGGPAGFGVASQNDVPMAAKGLVISSAFLGVEMKCARCHDAPSHRSLQKDLFQLGALLARKPLTVPKTSSVSLESLAIDGRKPLIAVTLAPGSKVSPAWPFKEFLDPSIGHHLAEKPSDTRDLLAALITAPQNERFAQVMANRLWSQLMGRGIVKQTGDWEKSTPSHPRLLRWLGHELVRQNYSLKSLARLIFNSHAYQRSTDPRLRETSPLFTSPAPRRIQAEQIVDSLFHATGKPFRTEEMNIDIDGKRALNSTLSLGQPRRAWMLASLSNERDRLSLTLPRIQAVSDVLSAFGWDPARQTTINQRSTDPTALQPAIISNGTVGIWLTRLSDDHALTTLALRDQPPAALLDQLFLRLLTRKPTPAEKELYLAQITPDYEVRRTSIPPPPPSKKLRPPRYVSWYNHLDPLADEIRRQEIIAARAGDPPTKKLAAPWRERFEDLIWALVNSPEMIYTR
ncbi:MAG: hypothetical protein ACI9NQ_000283 [Paracoccaceae bacterium]|jgi:hypothetical protein